MPRRTVPMNLEMPDRLQLERWVAAQRMPQQVTQRCRFIPAAADGRQNQGIAEDLEANPKTAALWRDRFLREAGDG